MDLFGIVVYCQEEESNLELVRGMIEKGVNVAEQHRRTQRTAFHEACRYGRLEMARLLVAADSRLLEMTDFHGKTPLQLICDRPWNRPEAVIHWLIHERQVNIQTRDKYGRTAGEAPNPNHTQQYAMRLIHQRKEQLHRTWQLLQFLLNTTLHWWTRVETTHSSFD